MDAISPPLENHIENLAQYIARITGTPLQKSSEIPVVIPPPIIKVNPLTPLPIQINASSLQTQKRGKLMWLWIGGGAVVLAVLILGVILLKGRLFTTPASTGQTPMVVSDTSAIVPSSFPTFTIFATATANPQGPTTPPTMKAATPGLLTSVMTANSNCWATANEGSTNVIILQAGDEVTILGKSADGNWYNLDFVNNTQQNYCNTSNLVTDCW
jgi:hypothetical protein